MMIIYDLSVYDLWQMISSVYDLWHMIICMKPYMIWTYDHMLDLYMIIYRIWPVCEYPLSSNHCLHECSDIGEDRYCFRDIGRNANKLSMWDHFPQTQRAPMHIWCSYMKPIFLTIYDSHKWLYWSVMVIYNWCY